jgi:hypothetical protein
MSNANVGPKRRGRFQSLCLTLGVISGLAAATVAYQFLPHYDPVRLEAWNKVQPRLQSTDEATKNEVDTSTGQIKKFFAERKQNARAFAADVLGLSGKWAYLKGYFYEGNHERYLEECFERNLFSSSELKSLIESAVSRYVSEVEGRENQLLVAIRADLEGTELASPKYLPALSSEAEFRREYAAMMQRVLPILTKDLGVSVTREIVSFVGSEIAATLVMEIGVSLATELGVSGGILGAGASSGAVTFGVGLVAGILVDMALDWIIRQAGYDPEGEIAAKVTKSLDDLERVILEGDKKTNERYSNAKFYSTFSWSSADRASSWAEAQNLESAGGLGLKHQLNHIHEVRSRLRDETLKGLILNGGVQ